MDGAFKVLRTEEDINLMSKNESKKGFLKCGIVVIYILVDCINSLHRDIDYENRAHIYVLFNKFADYGKLKQRLQRGTKKYIHMYFMNCPFFQLNFANERRILLSSQAALFNKH